MLNEINNILSDTDLEHIQLLIADAQWLPGVSSAGAQARVNKTNEEMDQRCDSWASINQRVVSQLYVHPVFQSLVLPLKVSAAFVSRCQPGMHYGQHIDDPIMGSQNARYRSDVAVTVFLNDPDAYDGGELTIQSRFGPVSIKLPAGSAVAYPASSLHEVMPVTRGERVVCALWAQSMIRDTQQRELLHDLDEARQALAQTTPKALVTQQVEHVYANLLRLWADV
ncbi:MAG: Fe2+-dependent dioxygenase [Granulosicoccaceae bacterium]